MVVVSVDVDRTVVVVYAVARAVTVAVFEIVVYAVLWTVFVIGDAVSVMVTVDCPPLAPS